MRPDERELELRFDDELLRAGDLRPLDAFVPLEVLLLDAEERDFELERRLRELDEARSEAGTSALTRALVSAGICFSRKEAMRSSSRRMPFAIFAVSVSPSAIARVSIAV